MKILQKMRRLRSDGLLFPPTSAISTLNTLWRSCTLPEKMFQRIFQDAIRLFTLSAEQKNEYAAYQLGKLYLSGKDVPKDVEAAIRWLTTSAEQGNQYAQYALGKLYFYDGDVPRDKEKSLYWLSLSAAAGKCLRAVPHRPYQRVSQSVRTAGGDKTDAPAGESVP